MKMRRPCCDKEGRNRGAWSKEEDQKLIDYIKIHGEVGRWHSLPKAAGLERCGKSCRLRWINYLRPNIKRGNFAADEEDLIIKLHALLGNRWSLIAGRLPGRTDNEVKNYWNSHIRKKLIRMGIDPNKHKIRHKPSPQITDNHQPNSPITSSSESKVHDDKRKFKRPLRSQGTNSVGQGLSQSSTISCMEEEVSPSWDLNLELSIAITSTESNNRRIVISENSSFKNDQNIYSTDHFQMENTYPSILPLFK